MDKYKWYGVNLPKNLIVKRYDKVSIFKLDGQFGELNGCVFSHPNALIKDTKDNAVKLSFKSNYTFTLSRATYRQKLSAWEFISSIIKPKIEEKCPKLDTLRDFLEDTFSEDFAENEQNKQIVLGNNTNKYAVIENKFLEMDQEYRIRLSEKGKFEIKNRAISGKDVFFDTLECAKAALIADTQTVDYTKIWAQYKNYINDKAYINNTPNALKLRNIFVCWKFEYFDENGLPRVKPAKIPYNPRTGGRAMANNPSSWASFDEAVEAVDKFGFDGIGVETGKSVIGIDIDNCIQNGCFSDIAIDILNKVKSYAEYSPSTVFDSKGRAVSGGIRIMAFGHLPKNVLNKECEFWISEHYVTITGHILPNSVNYMPKIADIQDELLAVYQKYGARPRAEVAVNFDDLTFEEYFTAEKIIDIIKKSSKMGEKFQRLCNGMPPFVWDEEKARYLDDIDEYYLKADGSPDMSKIDGAFCRILVFMRATPEQIDIIYRAQCATPDNPALTVGKGLARAKWDRGLGDTTYGGYQIRRAFEIITNRYAN